MNKKAIYFDMMLGLSMIIIFLTLLVYATLIIDKDEKNVVEEITLSNNFETEISNLLLHAKFFQKESLQKIESTIKEKKFQTTCGENIVYMNISSTKKTCYHELYGEVFNLLDFNARLVHHPTSISFNSAFTEDYTHIQSISTNMYEQQILLYDNIVTHTQKRHVSFQTKTPEDIQLFLQRLEELPQIHQTIFNCITDVQHIQNISLCERFETEIFVNQFSLRVAQVIIRDFQTNLTAEQHYLFTQEEIELLPLEFRE